MHPMIKPLVWLSGGLAGVLAPAFAVAQQQGQVTGPEIFYACYVPGSGTVYRIKVPGGKDKCTSPQHVEFSWNSDIAASLLGAKGEKGDRGLPGPIGPTGSTGPIGPTGSQGPAGSTGSSGSQGLPGPAGPTGPAGPPGMTGSAGPLGPMGPTGPAGPAGATGQTGAQGVPGPTGPQGSVGPTGPLGPQGPVGMTGALGPAGTTGPAGAIGPTGPGGASGPVGPIGPTGAVGPTGPTGPMPSPPVAWTAGAGADVLTVDYTGTGARAGVFRNTNNVNAQPALEAISGGGPPLLARRSTGSAAIAEFFNSSLSVAAVEATGRGRFNGGVLTQGSNGHVLLSMEQTNPATTFNLAELTNRGMGIGLFVQHMNMSANSAAAYIFTQGLGTGLHVQHAGNGQLALFQTMGTNVIRFDRTGKGFFNNGTQTGGADVAEAFEVEGARAAYQPGDVLVISDELDRRVEKSAEPYSTRVIGVHATKPGVLLTDRDIEANLDDTVPLGVIGVIPTRVTSEGGVIKRGDLLVTSSTVGHAMKGRDPTRMMGAVLGKALQEFAGTGSGVILVLVNVR